MDVCKSPLVNRRGVIPEYLATYLASPRVPGNVPSRVVVTRSRQRHSLNATLSVSVAIGWNRQPTVSLVKLASLCRLSGAVGRLLLSLILTTTPFCAVIVVFLCRVIGQSTSHPYASFHPSVKRV